MGPLAGAEFMVRLALATPADQDQDHIPAILWSDPGVPDRTAAIRHGGADPLPRLSRGLAGLLSMSAGAVCIACNTAHYWYDALTEQAGSVPILHVADAVRDALEANGVIAGSVGVLATEGTEQAEIYQHRWRESDLTVLHLAEGESEQLVWPAIRAVKAGRPGDARGILRSAVTRMKELGASAVVLACSELSVAYEDLADLPGIVIDSMDALVATAVRWWEAQA